MITFIKLKLKPIVRFAEFYKKAAVDPANYPKDEKTIIFENLNDWDGNRKNILERGFWRDENGRQWAVASEYEGLVKSLKESKDYTVIRRTNGDDSWDEILEGYDESYAEYLAKNTAEEWFGGHDDKKSKSVMVFHAKGLEVSSDEDEIAEKMGWKLDTIDYLPTTGFVNGVKIALIPTWETDPQFVITEKEFEKMMVCKDIRNHFDDKAWYMFRFGDKKYTKYSERIRRNAEKCNREKSGKYTRHDSLLYRLGPSIHRFIVNVKDFKG